MGSNKVCHSFVSGFVCKTNINGLLGVQVSVPIICSSEGSRQGGTSCVDGLPDVGKVDPTSDFLDENRG